MRNFARIAISLFASLLLSPSIPALAQGAVLNAQFTSTPITVDGVAEPAWNRATPANIAICMNPGLTAQLANCQVSGTVRALWNGPLLYLLFTITDPDITTASTTDTNRSSVQIFVDQDNDKFPKFEEDDGQIIISAAAQQTGNNTNAGLRYYPTVWSTHLQSYAVTYRTDSLGNKIGYTVEVAWNIGDRPLRNGTKLGMEFSVNAASSATNTNQYRLFWSSGNNKGTDSNTMWGTVVLTGYDDDTPMQLNTFMLQANIKKATPAAGSADGLVRGIWVDETDLNSALALANAALSSTSQREIDSANAALDTALRGLRRSGKYPDPYDLRTVNSLPDPFRFFDGSHVKTLADWSKRREQIKDLAQYYEFGYMPAAPQSLSAVSTSATSGTLNYKSIVVSIQDKGTSASFTPVLYLPTTGQPPYPVIVELDIFASPLFAPPNSAFLSGGYAVLSIPTWDFPAFGIPGIASDDGNHTGAFFQLYPYQLDTAGNDRGVLLAWAWGASRGTDALEYLAAHDPSYANLLDLSKLVVTGFSRWGKASLVAGFLDDRFQVTAPGGSGSGGAAPYRYDSFGNVPFRHAPFGNVYPWGQSPGAEVLGDHVRHQTHNSNEMIRRFLNDVVPAPIEPRMYLTDSWGYGDRLPFDHHEEIAAIAPRAVLIDNTNDDYADNAEGDSIGFEGAKPVYQFLGASQNLALDLYMGGGGHSLKPSQAQNIVNFSNLVLFGTPPAPDVKTQLTTDPYLNAGTYDTYYGGLKTMMPWTENVPHANHLVGLGLSSGTPQPALNPDGTFYRANVPNSVQAITVTPTVEDPAATITVNGQNVASGQSSQTIGLKTGLNSVVIVVTSMDGVERRYQLIVNRPGPKG
jgi:endo-1,4-beta-xylanase